MPALDESPFRFNGLWQWNPVSCVGPRGYDERHLERHSAWFHDRTFMSRCFDSMREAGLDTWVLANTHPFPFMIDMKEYPDARLLTAGELARRQAHYHWLFETALAKGLKPFVLFHTCYVPDIFGQKYDIRPKHSYEPPPLAYAYTRACVRGLCDTYPELAGIYGEASENVRVDLRAAFANQAVVKGIHDSRQRPVLFFRGWVSDPVSMKAQVLDAYEGEAFFGVKYTWEHLVGPRPDPEFLRWVNTCGAERVAAEFWLSNFQPFGCHDLDLAAAIRAELQRLGCAGFTSHPMDLYGSPFVQGARPNILQLDRDRDWYATLSGKWPAGGNEAARRFGLDALPAGSLSAAAQPLVRASRFMTGNKQNFLQPQLLAALCQTSKRLAELQNMDVWQRLPALTQSTYGRWPDQLDGRSTRYPSESAGDYGLPELIAELDALELQWADVPDSAPADGEVYEAWRDDLRAQHALARAWVMRARAVDAHFSGKREQALAALRKSLERVRTLPAVLGFDGPYRLLVARFTFVIRWSELIEALEQEIADYAAGQLAEHYFFGTSEFYEAGGRDAG